MIKPKRMMVDRLIRHFRANENMESCRRNGERVTEGRERDGSFDSEARYRKGEPQAGGVGERRGCSQPGLHSQELNHCCLPGCALVACDVLLPLFYVTRVGVMCCLEFLPPCS